MLLFRLRQQLARRLQLGFKARLSAGKRMLGSTTQRAGTAGLQIVPVLVKPGHQFRLPHDLALSLDLSRQQLQLRPILLRLRVTITRLLCQSDRIGLRLSQSLLKRLRLRVTLAALRQSFMRSAPLAHDGAPLWQMLGEIRIGGIFLQPALQRHSGVQMRRQRLLRRLAL